MMSVLFFEACDGKTACFSINWKHLVNINLNMTCTQTIMPFLAQSQRRMTVPLILESGSSVFDPNEWLLYYTL
jgi:hypothetical protein